MLYQNELNSVDKKIRKIGLNLVESNETILKAIDNCDNNMLMSAKSYIKNSSTKINNIDNEIIKILALYSPEARDLRQVVSYLKITNELNRAIVNTRSFIKGFLDICNKYNIKITKEYSILMQTSTVKAIKLAISMLEIECEDELRDILNDIIVQESKIDDLYEIIEKKLAKEASKSLDFEQFHNTLKTLRKSSKIADRAISIGNLILYIHIGGEFYGK